MYRPDAPQFTVVHATVYNLNTTSPPPFISISTSMQFTFVIENPDKKSTITYEKLVAYVSYRNQSITPLVDLAPVYIKWNSSVEVSWILGGNHVPVTVEVVNGLARDETHALRVVVFGWFKDVKPWKHGVYVECDIRVGLKTGLVGQVLPVIGLSSPQCDVYV
ncbi:Late embryogenesis abundant (LEA) hydroxyproline-rich glycoprotein family [Euphorbia peplus]|nr:Late embryogenesis abundant (LEA) hydroxyproline-rich glycoprotein family [Euphorbia peplus]